MSYATLDILLTRFGERELVNASDRVGSGVIDAARVADSLSEADNEIDAALGGRYALPLSTVPGLLVDLACAIARYKLYSVEAPVLVRERYDDARSTLKQLALGTLSLPGAGAVPIDAASAEVAFVSEDRLFTRQSMRDL